jgi:hypothetical protein
MAKRKTKGKLRPRAEEANEPRVQGTFRIKKSVKDRLAPQASREVISVNNLIEKALELYLDAKEEDEITEAVAQSSRLFIEEPNPWLEHKRQRMEEALDDYDRRTS